MLSLKFWKKTEENELFDSPQDAMGFSKETDYLQVSSLIQRFFIKKYNFQSLEQVDDIKKQLTGKKILIVNAREILQNNRNIEELTQAIEDIKGFLKKSGGSIGRLGEHYLILTPSAHIKIAN